MYCDASPTPTPPVQNTTPIRASKSLASYLFYAMTNISSSNESIFQPDTKAMANDQVIHILSSAIGEDTNNTSYAVQTSNNNVYITPYDTITLIPALTPKLVSISSTSASTRSSKSRSSRSCHHHKNKTPPPSVKPPPISPPVDIVSIPDDTSLGVQPFPRAETLMLHPLWSSLIYAVNFDQN